MRGPRAYVTASWRATALLIGRVAESLRVRLDLSGGWQVASAWASFDLPGPVGAMRQRVSQQGDQLVLERRLELRKARVTPGAYPAFVGWARAVAEAIERDLVLVREVE